MRQGKFIEVELAETDEAKARAAVEKMCKELLANTRDRELLVRARAVTLSRSAGGDATKAVRFLAIKAAIFILLPLLVAAITIYIRLK